ncbi:DinB family protein [Hymenobacter norwichensis]|uniref:DinB family protein n=1 Tax=Hymenobacter norwichensis TaxID=223903 RepID=UPI0003B66E8F|nr:DinB family protein [Hymenobacter norwichensis]
MHTAALLQQLQQQIQEIIATLEHEFTPLPDHALRYKPTLEQWSVLECLEHLNRYARYYHPILATALGQAVPSTNQELRFTWLGRKSYDMMRPENPKAHKTLARMNPVQSSLGRGVLAEFQQRQQEMLALLAQAAGKDLNHKAVPVEFFRLLRLRVGEALLFVVAHTRRHVQQARRVVATTELTVV